MTKKEFIAMSLPYGLKLKYKWKENIYPINGYTYDECFQDGNMYIPIIRPFTDLYKECVQADYKKGEVFIPIVELARIAYENKSAPWVITKDMTCVYNDRYKDEFRLYDGFFHVISDNRRNSFTYIPPQFELFQQLIKWHFWPNMKKDEDVIYVTGDFNPYK